MDQKLRVIADMQLDSAQFIMLFAQIGDKLHMVGDMRLENVAINFATLAKRYNMPLQELLVNFNQVATDIYNEPDNGKVVSISRN